MSKVDALIQEFCPDGVEYMQLGDIEDAGLIKLGRGNVISKKDIAIEPGDYPIYSSSAAGVGEFGRYGKYMFDDERLSWSVDGGGRFFYRHAHKYSVTNVSGWLKVLDSSRIDIKYLFYALDSAWSTKKFDYTKKAHPSVIRNEYKIPVPPLEVQKEIVNILDKFTQLEAELSAELEARRKQYKYYRSQLLTFDNTVRWATIANVMSKTSGTKVTAQKMKELHKEGAPVKIFAGGKTYAYFDYSDLPEKDVNTTPSVVVKSRGIIEFEYIDTPFSHKNEFWSYSSKDENVNTKYVYYVLKNNEPHFQRLGGMMQMPQISSGDTNNFKIPIPSLDEQNRIVAILDKFDNLTNSIAEGLPAEINARRRQYEYYRTKLLTFQELSA